MNTQQSANKTARSMADLLKSHQSSFVALHKGNTVQGTITKLTSSEILLDINTKTEAVVLEKDKKILKQMLTLLKVGDRVHATVLNPESDMGYPVVSLRRFIDDKLWEKLETLQKDQEQIVVMVKEGTKGGFLVETAEGMSGFLPNSHISFTQNQSNFIGQKISVVVFESNREARKVIFSQKALSSTEDFKKAKKTLKPGQKITVTVVNTTSFGVFVSVPLATDKETYVDGLIHISEVSWEKLTDISHMFTTGEKIEAVVLDLDGEAKRVDLSIKRLSPDPFEDAVKRYSIDQKVTGTISKIIEGGIILELGQAEGKKIEGMIRKDKLPPTVSYNVGDTLTATVTQIDTKKRRIILVPVLLEKPIGYR